MASPETQHHADTPDDNPQSPSILAKAFRLLDAFNFETRVLSLTELSEATGMPKSTVHRLLGRLVPLGIIEAHGSKYRVGVRLLAMTASTPVDLMHTIALPHLAKLHAWAGENVSLGVLRGDQVVILEAFFRPDTQFKAERAGTRLPVTSTAIGRSMIAFLPDEELSNLLSRPSPRRTSTTMTDPGLLKAEMSTVRSRRIAVQRDEYIAGMTAIASPLLIRGWPVGSVSLQFESAKELGEPISQAVKLTATRIANETRAAIAEHEDWFPHDL